MFNDTPIENLEEDKLNREKFINNITDVLVNYSEEKSLTIGIIGDWGYGKSSLINMTLNKIKREYPEKFRIVNYNPWDFSQKDSIYYSFFNEILFELNGDKFKDVYSALERIRNYLSPIGDFSLSILDLKSGFPIFAIIKSIWSNFRSPRKSLDQSKVELNKKLKKSLNNQKIIVVIDDIDRITNDQIKELFQLVHSIADFDNIIYLLSFDKNVVVNALKESQYSGEDYLNKIVQIPIEIPLIDEYQKEQLFYDYLNKLPQKYLSFIEKNRISSAYFEIYGFFRNIRDIKRFFNILMVYLPVIYNEINIIDFMIISTLQLFEPKLYKLIKENKDILVGESTRKDRERKDIYNSFLNEENLNNKTINIKQLLVELFPRTTQVYLSYNLSIDPDMIKEYKSKKRICTSEYFENYFRFDISTTDISQNKIDQIIYSKSEQEITEEIFKLNSQNKIVTLISKINDNINDIPQYNIKILLNVFIKQSDKFKKDYKMGIDANIFRIQSIITSLLLKISEEDTRFNILKDINKENKTVNYTLTEFIDGQYNSKKREVPLLFTQKHLNDIINDLSTNIANYWIKEDIFYNHEKFIEIIIKWHDFGGDSFNKFINNVKSDDKLLLHFISKFLRINQIIHQNIMNSESYIEPKQKLDFSSLEYVIDINFVQSKINNMDLQSMNLDKNEKIALDMFYEHYLINKNKN